MKLARIFFVLIGTFCCTGELFAQFLGGDNDGAGTNIGCIQSLNGTTALIPGPINGSTQFCAFATEVFSISPTGTTPLTTYTWSVPAGASIISGQGTTTVLVSFGNTDGNVSVDVSNECVTVSSSLPVTQNACNFYAGDSNDGFASNIGCIQQLDGGPALIPGAITGSTEFCPFATEAYNIVVSGATTSTVYTWAVPAGATITSGQGTSSIVVTFGGSNGTISVDISNECETVNQTLAVTSGSCTFFAGGDNDGFSTNVGCIQTLNGTSSLLPGAIIGSTEFCPFATEVYTISVSGSTSSTVYTWSVPAGATITSGQGTNSIVVTFGGSNGTVSVDVNNECFSANQTLVVSAGSCTFFAGGINDGFSSNVGCIQTLNGTSSLLPGAIIGSTEFCPFATEAYTISVSGSTSSTVYTWSVPAGATITSGQGTNSIVVTFGGSNGTISVDVNNECSSANQTLAVTAGSCTFFAGGNNDGFASNDGCIQSLNGGSGLVPGPIVGSAQFCAFATEFYTITVAGATASTTYVWSVPAGATITSGQGTNSVLVTFGNTNGSVSVVVNNTCSTANASLAVSSTSCLFYAGGSNDGFSVTTSLTNIPLPIELYSFAATAVSNKVDVKWVTASEINNAFFTVQRSGNGLEFEIVAKVDGAGTTNQKQSYRVTDENPILGRSYYRLSQTDFDGSVSYSKIVTVYVIDENVSNKISLYPNPLHTGGVLRLKYFSEAPEKIILDFANPLGRFLSPTEISLQTGWNDIPVAVQFPTSGIYLVRVRTSHGEGTIRLVVVD